jgi:hypothetical protein
MKRAIALLAAAALVAGCGDDNSDNAAGTAAQKARPAAPGPAVPRAERERLSDNAPKPSEGTRKPSGPYVGRWGARLSLKQLIDAEADTRLAGEFKLELRADGTYAMSNGLDPESKGRYAAGPGNALVFKQDSGCDQNNSFAGSRSVYEWKVTGDDLVLTLVRAETKGCTGRSDTLTTPRWKRR